MKLFSGLSFSGEKIEGHKKPGDISRERKEKI